MLKKLFMHLCKCYKHVEAPPIRKTTHSIQMFTDGRHRGLSIRPTLMCNEASETAIVGNLVAFKTCGSTGALRTNHPKAIDHILIYKRMGVHPVVVDHDVVKLQRLIDHVSSTTRPKFRLRGKHKSAHVHWV